MGGVNLIVTRVGGLTEHPMGDVNLIVYTCGSRVEGRGPTRRYKLEYR